MAAANTESAASVLTIPPRESDSPRAPAITATAKPTSSRFGPLSAAGAGAPATRGTGGRRQRTSRRCPRLSRNPIPNGTVMPIRQAKWLRLM